MKRLPEGWVEVGIGSISAIVAGGTPGSKDPTNFASPGSGIPWVTPADLSGYTNQAVMNGARDLSQQGYDSCSATLVPVGSVLFSSRAPIGYVAIAAQPVSTSQGFKTFVLPEGLDSRFLYYQLKHLKPVAEALATGTTFKELSSSAIAALSVRVAPISEQRRIADKLDVLVARINACRERLDRMPRAFSDIRRKVLDAAMSGHLTEAWRRNRRDSKEWEEQTLADACTNGRIITYGVIKLGEDVATGVPCLRTSNVRWLRIDTDGMKRIDPSISAHYGRTVLEGGEVLVNVRGTLGGVAVSTSSMKGWNISREIAVVPCDPAKFEPEFLAFCMASPQIQHKLSGMEKGVAYTGINIEDLRTLRVRRPEMVEQAEIVKRIEALFGLIDSIEAKWRAARDRVDQLTPTLLEMAFCGELVARDPIDLPASALLSALAADKVNLVPTRPKRRDKSMRANMKAAPKYSFMEIVEKMEEDEFSFDELKSRSSQNYESLKAELFAALSASKPLIEQYFDADVKSIRLRRTGR